MFIWSHSPLDIPLLIVPAKIKITRISINIYKKKKKKNCFANTKRETTKARMPIAILNSLKPASIKENLVHPIRCRWIIPQTRVQQFFFPLFPFRFDVPSWHCSYRRGYKLRISFCKRKKKKGKEQSGSRWRRARWRTKGSQMKQMRETTTKIFEIRWRRLMWSPLRRRIVPLLWRGTLRCYLVVLLGWSNRKLAGSIKGDHRRRQARLPVSWYMCFVNR